MKNRFLSAGCPTNNPVGRSEFFSSDFQFSIDCNIYTEDIRGKKLFFLKKHEKFQSALFSPVGRSTGNNFLFKGGLMILKCMVTYKTPVI